MVNAETEVSQSLNFFGKPPAFSAMLDSCSAIAITRYNYETIMLVRENFRRWTEEVQQGRCGENPVSTEPRGCGDIKFYLIEVRFDALKDAEQRNYYKQLPTSFSLSVEQVAKLREAARQILTQSEEYQRFLNDLR